MTAKCTSPCVAGGAVPRERDRPSGASAKAFSLHSLLGLSRTNDNVPGGWTLGKDGRTTFHVIADLDADMSGGGKDNVRSRAKLDQADALPADECITGLVVENDAARQQTGNL